MKNDLISRQAVCDVLKNIAIEKFELKDEYEYAIQALIDAEDAISGIPCAQPDYSAGSGKMVCEDAVSRAKVLRCIKESRDGIDWGQSEDAEAFLHYSATLYRTIASHECLSSVTPTQHWIPVNEDDPATFPPVDDEGISDFILLSFENFHMPCIGRYEQDDDGGGSFHDGDSPEPFEELNLIVNAWMPLPKCYKEKPDT